MTRTLEVITIGQTPLFSRADANNLESNDIIALQRQVSDMVKEVKTSAGNKKEIANSKIAHLVALHTLLGSRFENLEQSIRELARMYWAK